MPEERKKIDRLLGAGVGIIVLFLLLVWSFPGLHPDAWRPAAIGAGLEPPAGLLPGLGIGLSGLLFGILPFSAALIFNGLIAKLMVAVCGMFAYSIFSDMMEAASGVGARDWRRRKFAIRTAALTAAVLFSCSDPLWRAAQSVSGTTFAILLTTAALACFVRTLRTGSWIQAVLSLALTGLLAAESPLGWAVLVFEIAVTVRYLNLWQDERWKDFLDPVRLQRTKWLMTIAFVGMFSIGVFLEMYIYASMGGLVVNGLSGGDLPVAYLHAYWAQINGSMSVVGLCLFLLCGVVPFALTTVMISSATDEDRYLSFGLCIVYVLSCLVAFMQLCPFEFLWMQHIAGRDGYSSELPVLLTCLLGAGAMAWGLFVLGVEVFCRDYEHIERMFTQDYADDDAQQHGVDRENVQSVQLGVLRLSTMLLPLGLAVLCIWGRRLPCDRALCAAVWEFVSETLDEATGVKYLFTDGACDSALRLESRRRGLDLVPVSMLGGNSRRDIWLRQAGTADRDDRMTLEVGAAETLRAWVTEKPSHLAPVALQLADDILRLDPDLRPTVCGALIRPVGGDAVAAQQSVERCHRLANGILAFHAQGVWRHAKDLHLKDLLLFVQFRLAVLARLRSITLDGEKNAKQSAAEFTCAERLDAENPALIETVRRLDWVHRQSGESLTPSEGLEVSLRRADFAMARRYAMPKLREAPDDPAANFALGMGYYLEGQYAKAEKHLLLVAKKCPEEAAVHNNLALLRLKTERFDEAEKDVEKALKLAPTSPEVKDTVKRVRAAKARRKTQFGNR